jgi:F420-dependent oxidoreductase-like protein
MRIGLFPGSVPGQSKTIDEVINQAVKAENDGFDAFWAPHLSGRGFDALTSLALAGTLTSRIELGTAVVPTYPRHPTALMQQAMTVQVASNGRLSLGIGPSHKPAVEDSWGLSYDRPGRHTREYLTVLNQLVEEGAASYSGEMYRVQAGAEMTGASPFPVLISALAPVMLRIAGELSAGTITWMCGIQTIGNHVVPRINRAAERAGRPSPRVCTGLPVAVTDDKAAAFEKAAELFGRYGGLVNYRRMLNIESVDGPADIAVIGDEAEVESRIRSFADAGVTDLLGSPFPVGNDTEASLSRTESLLAGLVGRV